METIITAIVLVLSLINWFISLNVYFTHDDINRKKDIKEINIQKLFDDMIPAEMAFHMICILICFVN